MLTLSFLFACTGGSTDTSTTIKDSDTADTDTSDPVLWEEHRVETSSTLNGVYSSGNGVYLVGTDGYAWTGDADGWTYMDPDTNGEDFFSLWGSGTQDSLALAAVAGTGQIARYVNGAWVTDNLDDVADYFGISGSGANKLVAVGWGRAATFDGTAWTAESLPNNDDLNDVYADGEDAVGVGEKGAIVHRAAGGTWTEETSGTTSSLNAVGASSLNDIWAVGDDGVAVHYDGSAWSVVPTGVTETLWGVFVPEQGACVAVGNNGTAITWDGSAFVVLNTGVDNNLYAVHGVSARNMWAVGNRGIALQYKAAE
jgi:hypothetical protein